jgi:hypothetical protein
MESAFPSARYMPVSLFGSVMSVAGLARVAPRQQILWR